MEPKSVDEDDLWDISKRKDDFLLDPTISKDQEKIAEEFNVPTGWKKYVDEQKGNTGNTVCTEYFNLLYLCKTIGKVPFDLHFVEARHRYTMVLYFMNAGLYNAKTNCIRGYRLDWMHDSQKYWWEASPFLSDIFWCLADRRRKRVAINRR